MEDFALVQYGLNCIFFFFRHRRLLYCYHYRLLLLLCLSDCIAYQSDIVSRVEHHSGLGVFTDKDATLSVLYRVAFVDHYSREAWDFSQERTESLELG